MTITFSVQDMSCGHCVQAITQAVKDVDAQAQVRIDLAKRRVEIDPAAASAEMLGQAIEDAGYTPVPAA